MTPQNARHEWDLWRAAVRRNSYDTDTHLQSLLALYRPTLDTAELRAFAQICTTELDALIRLNNRDENLHGSNAGVMTDEGLKRLNSIRAITRSGTRSTEQV